MIERYVYLINYGHYEMPEVLISERPFTKEEAALIHSKKNVKLTNISFAYWNDIDHFIDKSIVNREDTEVAE